jgi:hypothetical protein
MVERDRPHLIVPALPEAEPFTSTQGGGSSDKPEFTGDRARHGRTLTQQFEQAVRASDETGTDGSYVSFESFPGMELALRSLDVQRSGEQPELIAVKEVKTGTDTIQIATVYIPHGKRGYFLKRLNDYVETAGEDKTKNAALVEGIAAIRRATIREMWTDPDDQFPADTSRAVWWEIWLRRQTVGSRATHGEHRARAQAEEPRAVPAARCGREPRAPAGSSPHGRHDRGFAQAGCWRRPLWTGRVARSVVWWRCGPTTASAPPPPASGCTPPAGRAPTTSNRSGTTSSVSAQ